MVTHEQVLQLSKINEDRLPVWLIYYFIEDGCETLDDIYNSYINDSIWLDHYSTPEKEREEKFKKLKML